MHATCGRTPRLTLGFALAIATIAIAAPAAAAHHGAAGTTDDVPATVERTVGSEVEVLRSGLYEVDVPRGPDLVTHGPDYRLAASGAGNGLGPGAPERQPACATDHHQHVLYARAPRSPDRYGEVKARIQAQVRRMNWALNDDSLASGGGTADYRVLCDSAGQVRVDRLVSWRTTLDRVVAAARAAGFDNPDADYTIFFDDDGGGACGIGSYADDDRLVAANANNEGGGYAIVYDGCWYDETPMHESGHAQGAVQYGPRTRPAAAGTATTSSTWSATRPTEATGTRAAL